MIPLFPFEISNLLYRRLETSNVSANSTPASNVLHIICSVFSRNINRIKSATINNNAVSITIISGAVENVKILFVAKKHIIPIATKNAQKQSKHRFLIGFLLNIVRTKKCSNSNKSIKNNAFPTNENTI